MIGSILVRMPEITREFDDEIGIEVINKYFVRVKGDVYIPLFNLPLLHPEIFSRNDRDIIVYELADITFNYYKQYLELRKRKRFEISVFLPEKYGGHTLYYLLQKFMIGEATPEEIEIVSEFLSREIFDGKRVRMDELLNLYHHSIFKLYFESSPYKDYEKSILVNTPIGVTPLYVSKYFLHSYAGFYKPILSTYLIGKNEIAFVNVLLSHFFDKSFQIGSTKFRFLKSIGELDSNWKNVKVISFRELYGISDAIIENNLEMTHPQTFVWVTEDCYYAGKYFSHSPILSAVGNAIDFKNKIVMFLFAILKSKKEYTDLSLLNKLPYLEDKSIDFFVTIVPFKNIRKFIYRDDTISGIFIIEGNGKTISVLSNDVGLHWVGVGRENIVRHRTDYDWWYGLLMKLSSPEHLKKAKEKTYEWLEEHPYYKKLE